ncbi:hypothetical protein Patl1_30831 [Pistacia atlantica]|uniref:Uncharacterized protein n=1 Tax=Pistacia atlantica TaxID=434234 RepID=A0ACC1AC80_9ROSI|nr:hypothetical protein Patl1_30831 [Pistacia atlantica]
MYFSEVCQLDSTHERSFQLYMNEFLVLGIIPQYGKVIELSLINLNASANTSFFLFASSTSTSPLLINALEVFTISDEITDGTSRDDVEGLASLKEKFEILQDWNGDPWLPSPFKWECVNCSTGATPCVTALYLNDFDLLDSLPDLSSMDALEIILYLHNNSLNGEIPDFLGNFPNLRQLNLADNDFSGLMPTSLSKNTKLKLV